MNLTFELSCRRCDWTETVDEIPEGHFTLGGYAGFRAARHKAHTGHGKIGIEPTVTERGTAA